MKKKGVWIGILILIFILIFTNPTNTDFKNKIPSSIYTGERISNWGIFSIYKATGISKSERRSDRTYLGIFKVFILIQATPPK